MTTPRPRLPIQGASLAPWAKRRPWRARIYYAGKERSLGYFSTKEEARAAHADAARHLGIKLKSEAQYSLRCVELRSGAEHGDAGQGEEVNV
jgi:hypothetical protein